MKTKSENYVPFSNGTQAMEWYSSNCDRCTKAYFPKEGKDYPSDATMRTYCSIGKECKLKYAIDIGFITGEIPKNIAEQIGIGEYGLKDCMMFSDNEDDGYKPPKRPKPDKTPDNQMVMPFEAERITENIQVTVEINK